jgi:site-specific DNA-methyltransferase (adenine-specific)
MKHQLCQGQNELWLSQIDKKINCIFSDWPDNIGLSYAAYDDNLPVEEYVKYMRQWARSFVVKADVTWISFHPKWIHKMGSITDEILNDFSWIEFLPCVQTFTFFQNCKTDLGQAQRPLWRFKHKDAPLYPEQIKVPSWREQNGDKRAKEGGKVPGTHFDFPRVTGNSKQRRAYHPTQLHEGLVERCIKLSTKEEDTVLDPFLGTGTTLRVCKRINRRCIGIEIDPEYCAKIAAEHDMTLREKGKLARWELKCCKSPLISMDIQLVK